MWCYQKPGFESLLLAELQRQQHCSQFCDTMLQTDGVSFPAHSCVLSAISPCISSALSSALPRPAGHNHLLDFQSLSAYTLLNLVRLLYSGEMVGEGEEERIESISAAAKLGIYGLVEVNKGREEEEEEEEDEDGGDRGTDVAVQTEENDGTRSRLREDECSERPSKSVRDVWTQTEDHTASPPQPAPVYETIDINVLQDLTETVVLNDTPHLPHVPVSCVYPLVEAPQPLPALVDSMLGPTAAGPINQSTSWAGDPQGSVVAAEEGQLQQFESVIPGCINHSVDTPQQAQRGSAKTVPKRGRRDRRRGEKEKRTPGALSPGKRTPGVQRQLGGLLQKVDVQTVKVSKLQMKFLQRWGMRTPRTGQGGGAVGRGLSIKPRKLLSQERISQKKSGSNKVWELSPNGAVQLCAGKRQRASQLSQPFFPDGCAQMVRAQLTTSCVLPPPQEPFDHLIEEVMMGLYMLPDGSASAPHLDPPPPPPAPDKPDWASLLLGADSAHPTQVAVAQAGAAGSGLISDPEAVLLQQQGEEDELDNILECFLSSFEQHLENCFHQEQVAAGGPSCSEAPLDGFQKQGAEADVGSQPRKDPSVRPNTSRAASGRHRKRWRSPGTALRGRTRVKESDSKLLQTPVVRLRRNELLPLTVKLQDIRPYLDVMPPSTANIPSSALKRGRRSSSSSDPDRVPRKWYPIRSQCAKCPDIVHVLDRPIERKRCKQAPGKKDSRPHSVAPSRSSAPAPQTRPAAGEAEQRQERPPQGEEQCVQPQDEEAEEATGRGRKRRAESDMEANDDNAEAPAKRICELSRKSDTTMENGHALPCEVKLTEPSVNMERGGLETEHLWSKASVSSREDTDEDIDVVGGVSPLPAPVAVCWPEPSEDEEEEYVDITG